MKSEQYFIVNQTVKVNLAMRIGEIAIDGKIKVTISDAGNKSVKQRGLQWKWNTEVARSGIGGKHEDTKNGVHLISKWRWAIPILIRDDNFFAELFAAWKATHGNDEEAMRWFVDTQVSTEKFSATQMAEYLTDFERHYSPLVNLTNPDLMGLKEGV